jgi:hypothetical protein
MPMLPLQKPTTIFKPVNSAAAITEFKATDLFSCSALSKLISCHEV